MGGKLTGDDYRAQAKERVKRFRIEQEKRGYKNCTIFLNKALREELKKLNNDKGFSRQEAMDYIFDAYLKSSVERNATINANKTDTNSVTSYEIPKSIWDIVPNQCQTEGILNTIHNALNFRSESVLTKAICYIVTKMNIDTPSLFLDILPNVLRDELYKDQYPEPPVEPLEFEDKRPMSASPESAPPKPEVGKMAELNMGQQMEIVDSTLPATENSAPVGVDEMTLSDPDLYRALDKTHHPGEAEPKQKQTLPERQLKFDLESDSKEEQRQRIYDFILDRHKKGGRGGKMSLQQIADALTEAKIKTLTGKSKWSKGAVDKMAQSALKQQ